MNVTASGPSTKTEIDCHAVGALISDHYAESEMGSANENAKRTLIARMTGDDLCRETVNVPEGCGFELCVL